MTFAKISQVAHYAPSQVISNQDLSERMDTVMSGLLVGQEFGSVIFLNQNQPAI